MDFGLFATLNARSLSPLSCRPDLNKSFGTTPQCGKFLLRAHIGQVSVVQIVILRQSHATAKR
jgi:hypothetical protein